MAHETTYHRDGTVTLWDVYTQGYLHRVRDVAAATMAALSAEERRRIQLHTAPAQWRALVRHAERIGLEVDLSAGIITLDHVDGREDAELALVDGQVRLYEPGTWTAYGHSTIGNVDGTRTLTRRRPSYYDTDRAAD